MNRWRIGWIALALVILLFGVMFRLYQIQVMQARSFSSQDIDLVQLAAESQSKELLIASGRGKIIDRNEEVFVGQEGWRLLVFPQTKQQINWRKHQFQQVAKIVNIPFDRFSVQLQNVKYPTILSRPDRKELILTAKQQLTISKLKIPGVLVVYGDGRMQEMQIGQQVMGRLIRQPFIVRQLYARELAEGRYTLQSRVGITGLEAAFEPFLHGSKEQVLSYYHTRRGKPLHGAQIRQIEKREPKSFHPYTLVTTLDKEIQRQAEYILQKYNVTEGAIVVQEIKSGDVLALASAPLGRTQQGQKNPWDHRALMEATPGSIFKLVVAMAGLEEGKVLPESRFTCKGKWDRYHLTDAGGSGHGRETFSQAFADSCNLYFGALSKELGGAKLKAYAERLGFNQQILWSNQKQKQFSSEHKGMIFSSDRLQQDTGAVVQTGIGQRDVKITPLQAANLVTALFHQGNALQPRIVSEIRRSDGRVIMRFPQKYLPKSKPFHTNTLRMVRQMMRMTVTEGTASSLQKTLWPLAGKTGTAQIGVNRNQYHKWMIGFGPVNQPRYAVSVLIKATKNPNDPRAKQIFGQIMDTIAELEKVRSRNR